MVDRKEEFSLWNGSLNRFFSRLDPFLLFFFLVTRSVKPRRSCRSAPCCSFQTGSSTDWTLSPDSSFYLTSERAKTNNLVCIHNIYVLNFSLFSTYVFHFLLEADVDFIALGQRFLKLIKLFSVEFQLRTHGRQSEEEEEEEEEDPGVDIHIKTENNTFFQSLQGKLLVNNPKRGQMF